MEQLLQRKRVLWTTRPSIGVFSKRYSGLMRAFKKDCAGASAVEMAILSPIVVGIFVMGSNFAHSVMLNQKIQSGSHAGATYLQDAMSGGDYASLSPSEVEGEIANQLFNRARFVVRDATGLDVTVGDIVIDAKCACPSKTAPAGGEGGPSTPYYKTSEFSSSKGEVCPSQCDDEHMSRVIAEIDIVYRYKDLIGKEKVINEHLVTRLR